MRERALRLHLDAAWGWLGLGSPQEALAELGHLAGENLGDPEVHQLRWEIAAVQKNWEEAWQSGRTLVQVAPESADSWIKQAYALHELKRTQEAFDALAAVSELFTEESTIPYNLACYSCQMGKLSQAMSFLKKACKWGGKAAIKRQALRDPDLAGVRGKLEEL